MPDSLVPQVFYSVKTRRDLANQWTAEPADADSNASLGRANYTYAIVARRFIAMLAENGIRARELDRPEMYDRTTVPGHDERERRPLHLIFKPAEEIRILRGAYNIGIVYWEFDKILTDSFGGPPVNNQRRMLGLLDEIWVANTYLKKTLEQAGLKNIHIVPCPVAIPDPPRERSGFAERLGELPAAPLQFDRSTTPRVQPMRDLLPANAGSDQAPLFLSILNPHDMRKDIETLLLGFLSMSAIAGVTPLLAVKLVIDNVQSTMQELNKLLTTQMPTAEAMSSSQVVFFSQALTDEAMAGLYQACHYYISVSRAEGQNLPLIEAMLRGCVAVAPAHTAMADYVTSDIAVVVPSLRKRAEAASTVVGSPDLFWYQCDPAEVGACVSTALRLRKDQRESLIAAARTSLTERFSPQQVWQTVSKRLETLA